MNILAIETSFDETACAVIQDGTKIISNVLATSHEMHDKYGGVVPEIAARRQLECIIPVITEALEALDRPARRDSHETHETFQASESSSDQASQISEAIKRHIDAIAVTVGPGLIGSLLVGVETAKTLAFVCRKPIIPVNHVLAHMYANFVQNESSVVSRQSSENKNNLTADDRKLIAYPAISLVVSGGHTELYLMKSAKNLTWLGGTLDDAAGECFDKTARLIEFGHDGGAAIEREANKFSIQHSAFSIHLPRPMIHDETLNFSFSGLKTAVMREWKKYSSDVIPAQAGIQSKENPKSRVKPGMTNERLATTFAYEIQESITDVLVAKTLRAAKQYGAKSILLSGGVAANTRLREKFNTSLIRLAQATTKRVTHHSSLNLLAPPKDLCTDNAVMIGACAFFNGEPTDWHKITAQPDLSMED